MINDNSAPTLFSNLAGALSYDNATQVSFGSIPVKSLGGLSE